MFSKNLIVLAILARNTAIAFGALTFSGMTAWAASNAEYSGEWDRLDPSEMVFVDRIAAAFFENDLRQAQAARIEGATAAYYVGLSAKDRAIFRQKRRTDWRAMGDNLRAKLRDAKRPNYFNLTDAQKNPFRRDAYRKLMGAADANDANISRNEI